MTRSAAISQGFKPISHLSPKTRPLRQPRAKKLKADIQSTTPSTEDQLEEASTEGQVPPPTPIAMLQQIGTTLGVLPENMTMEKLMSSSDAAPMPLVSNDD